MENYFRPVSSCYPNIKKESLERSFPMLSFTYTSNKRLLPPVFTGSTLKFIALITMLIDHIGAVFLEKGVISAYNQGLPSALSYEESLFFSNLDQILRNIGRIAFPIFCFLLVEGLFHTSNRAKYAQRLFLFALLSEVPFDLAFNYSFLETSYQNVMFTLLFGFLTIWAMEKARELHPALLFLPALLGLGAGWLFHGDYNWKGILLIIVLYLFYAYPLEKTIAGCICLLWEPWALLAFIPINLYNQKKGQGLKYLFYFFYPAHLLALFLLRYLIFRI